MRTVLPRLVLALVLLGLSYLSFMESLYLSDQARLVGEPRITVWMWVFRVVCLFTFVGSGVLLALCLGVGKR